MKAFVLKRIEDFSGISGTGIVAEGAEFADGTCAMRWLTRLRSTAIYASLDEIQAIHGHDGRTEIHYIDLSGYESRLLERENDE